MAETRSVDLVEEPLSGMLFPAELQGQDDSAPKDLVGTAVRKKRIMGLSLQVYAVGVYVPQSLALPVQEGSSLTEALFTSPEEKTLCLTFLQSLTRSMIVSSFKETLGQFGVSADSISAFADCLPPSVSRGTQVCLSLRPRLGKLIVEGKWLADASVIEGSDMNRALHEMFFGPRSILTGLEESLQTRQEVLFAARKFERNTSPDDSSFEAGSSLSELDSPQNGQESFQSPHCDKERFASPLGLPSIQSGSELASTAAAVSLQPTDRVSETISFATQGADDAAAHKRSRSWKDRAGRRGGNDGYRFGDLTRTVVNKTRGRLNNDTGSFAASEDWPGALVAEGEEAPWVAINAIPHLDAEALARQQLSASLYKHHTSPVRGNLIPQWSLRFFELKAGTLYYRRRRDGSVKGSLSLDGAHVVVEPLKPCHIGDCFVFSVVAEAGQVFRLSCSDLAVASSFALAAAAACAFFHAQRCHSGRQEELEAATASAVREEQQTAELEVVPKAAASDRVPNHDAQHVPETLRPACQEAGIRTLLAEAVLAIPGASMVVSFAASPQLRHLLRPLLVVVVLNVLRTAIRQGSTARLARRLVSRVR
eukprot:CAMPEP_0172677040 /NCGR_PEP_ID=MMETSP1074-20121228/14395_1 /TAXON_ID=2916 /ORGANISM="Ceratium fusus, Strain PA161109" /LENGTH=594 /DNA_ID=CAMNT_0013494817 /DNA_START=60 /DNA_END=1844 /DNA_ORIENTATION=-